MTDELAEAFAQGHLSRRAFVRQLVDGGMAMPDALALADSIVAPPPLPGSEPSSAPPPPGAGRSLPDRPVRNADVVIEFVGDGYLLFDNAVERMHSLNHTAALVLELCTGDNDLPEIARLLGREYGLASPPEAETRECVAALHAEGLVR